ncbi:MAG: terminase small subunit [Clostridia bacterium]|nr:terminase small subunit [Clostridia bacterium]
MNENLENLLDDLKNSDHPNVKIFAGENGNIPESDSSDAEVSARSEEDADPDILALSDREKLFCVNYVHNGMNIYQAAVSAGYAPSYAKSSSYKLRENVGIQKYISRLFENIELKMMNELTASKQELMKFWTDVMRGKLQNPHAIPEKAMDKMEQLSFLEMDKDGNTGFSVPDECKIPLSQRLKASEYLAKHFDMFADVLQKNETTQNVFVSDDLKNMSEDDLKRLAQRLAGGMNG